jgi:hypothetical protein
VAIWIAGSLANVGFGEADDQSIALSDQHRCVLAGEDLLDLPLEFARVDLARLG